MARIVLSILFLIALAILIVMNIGASAPVNVFGWQIEDLSITVIAIVSFVAGVVFSFVFYLMSYLERTRRDRLAKRKKKLKDQEAQLKNREQQADELEEESKRRLENARAIDAPKTSQRPGPLQALFGGRRSKQAAIPSSGHGEAPSKEN